MPTDKNSQRFAERDTAAFEFLPPRKRLAQVHAPKGGVSIGGKEFKGGEFIPGEVLDKATTAEKAAVEGGEAKAEPKRKAAKPTQRERNAVVDYTTDKFQNINGVLRGQQEATPSEAKMITDIDSFLDKSQKREGATVRSFQIPADSPLREMLQVGGMISDAAYMSTKAKPSVVDTIAFRDRAAPPNRVVMRVEGQNGVDISGLSLNPGEGEVLYPRGAQFEVVQAVHLDNGAILAVVKETLSEPSSLSLGLMS